jgi:hypothetical protein
MDVMVNIFLDWLFRFAILQISVSTVFPYELFHSIGTVHILLFSTALYELADLDNHIIEDTLDLHRMKYVSSCT